MGHGEVLFNHQQLSFPLLINDLATKLLDELFNSGLQESNRCPRDNYPLFPEENQDRVITEAGPKLQQFGLHNCLYRIVNIPNMCMYKKARCESPVS